MILCAINARAAAVPVNPFIGAVISDVSKLGDNFN
jgi:hypothetical protein